MITVFDLLQERVTTMKAYGAKVTLTPAEGAMEGARDYAEAEFAKGGCVMLNQFTNPDNPLAHYETTGAHAVDVHGIV